YDLSTDVWSLGVACWEIFTRGTLPYAELGSNADVFHAVTEDQLVLRQARSIPTAVYEGYENNPPGITFMGKKTWNPGRHLSNFVASAFGIEPREQKRLVDQIATAITATVPAVRDAMKEHPTFSDIGKRMLLAWRLGIDGLRDDRVYAMPAIAHTAEMTQFSPPVKRPKVSRRLGQRPLRPKPRKSR
ncbi:MAG: protein kinase, partial [Verrucomicrobiae bacterium]|nr:protein kinase [Verrucomicrobiae bacterium]